MENNNLTESEIENMTWDEIQENIIILQKADAEYIFAEGNKSNIDMINLIQIFIDNYGISKEQLKKYLEEL